MLQRIYNFTEAHSSLVNRSQCLGLRHRFGRHDALALGLTSFLLTNAFVLPGLIRYGTDTTNAGSGVMRWVAISHTALIDWYSSGALCVSNISP